jgi:hypothetical protein
MADRPARGERGPENGRRVGRFSVPDAAWAGLLVAVLAVPAAFSQHGALRFLLIAVASLALGISYVAFWQQSLNRQRPGPGDSED